MYAPIAHHLPRLDGVEVRGAAGFGRVGNAPLLIQLLHRRLNVTLIIRAPRHEHRLFSVPNPVKSKPGVRLGMHWSLQLRFLPTLAAISGDFNLGDRAATGPSQASNLDISRAKQLHST